MMLMDLPKRNKPKTFDMYMLCLSLRQYYLDQVHWVPHLREISGVKPPQGVLILQSSANCTLISTTLLDAVLNV